MAKELSSKRIAEIKIDFQFRNNNNNNSSSSSSSNNNKRF